MKGVRDRLAARVADRVNPRDTDAADAVARIVTGAEMELAQATNSLKRAVGLPADVSHDRDRRREEVLCLLDSIFSQDFGELAARRAGCDSPKRAAKYSGLDREEWKSQMQTWLDEYDSEGVLSVEEAQNQSRLREQVAEMHVRQIFGVTRNQFEDEVVFVDDSEVVKNGLVGPIRGMISEIERATDEIQQGDDPDE